MNLQPIRKNLGQNPHLRPIPHRVGDAGQRLPAIDDLWRLDGILDEPARLRLVNISTQMARGGTQVSAGQAGRLQLMSRSLGSTRQAKQAA
jgi:hypothetical protein